METPLTKNIRPGMEPLTLPEYEKAGGVCRLARRGDRDDAAPGTAGS